MGNFHSSWLRRPRDEEHLARTGGVANHQQTVEEASPVPYGLRRTVARIRRRVSSHRGTLLSKNMLTLEGSRPTSLENDSSYLARHSEPMNISTSSLSSIGSRRRAREAEDILDMDASGQNAAQRPRFEALAREAFTPDPEDPSSSSMFFYFSLPRDALDGTESRSSTPRRRSTRLQQASEYFRERFGRSSPNENRVELPFDQDQSQRQLVLVRIRQLPIQEAAGSDGGSSDVRSVFQWTVYFVLPRDSESDSSIPPSSDPFDADSAIQRAFSVLQAMMSGENMSYEDWTRLQEMMGFVSHGVTKEQVEEYCAATPFISSLNIGASCPICLGEYQTEESVRMLPCVHAYHADCIDAWLKTCNNCPLCRQPPVPQSSVPATS